MVVLTQAARPHPAQPWGPRTLPLGDLAVAMRGERRVLPRGEFLGVVFRLAPRRSKLLPSFLGVFKMLNAMDWRLSDCGGREGASMLSKALQAPLPSACKASSLPSRRAEGWELEQRTQPRS